MMLINTGFLTDRLTCEGVKRASYLGYDYLKDLAVEQEKFLTNVKSRSRSLYAIARPSVACLSSVCLSSVTFVRPTQAVEIFGNISTALLGTLAIR